MTTCRPALKKLAQTRGDFDALAVARAEIAGDIAFDLPSELAALGAMDLAQLRARWRALIARPVPPVRQTLLRMALASQLQTLTYGTEPLQTRQRLALLGRAAPRKLAVPRATRLVREWKGTLHTVLLEADGTIRWDGRSWHSLSEVARTITGTRWSGPAFFGLRHKSRIAA